MSKTINLKEKIENENFGNLIKQNQRVFCVPCDVFSNLGYTLNAFKHLLNTFSDPKILKVFTLNFNTDMILLDYLKENKDFNIESFKTHIHDLKEKIQKNTELIDDTTITDIEGLRKQYNAIFKVNRFRTDFLGFYHKVLIANIVEKTWFIRAEITDILFELTMVIDDYLTKLFGSDANKPIVIHTKD